MSNAIKQDNQSRGPRSQRGHEWMHIEQLWDQYQLTGELRYRDAASALMWNLAVADCVAIARRKGFKGGNINWHLPEREASGNLSDYAQSIVVSVMARKGFEHLLDERAEKYDSIGLRTWMSKRMEWKMLDRVRRNQAGSGSKEGVTSGSDETSPSHDPEATTLTPAAAVSQLEENSHHDAQFMHAPKGWSENEPIVDDSDARDNRIFLSGLIEAVLDDKEKASLALYVQGHERIEAASLLGISEGSYKALLEKIFGKLKKAADENP